MAIRITHRRMSPGGTRHEHIVSVKWTNEGSGESGSNTVAEIVDFIDNKNGKAYVAEGGTRIDVGTVHPHQGHAYIRTFRDSTPTDNLLHLPTY